MVVDTLPNSVRYIKNGAGGAWWAAAKAKGQLHAGWSRMPQSLLQAGDPNKIKDHLASLWLGKSGLTQDFNQLWTLLDHPSQHVWVTFEDDCLWWCTVGDDITFKPEGEVRVVGHFWLTCARPWSNESLNGKRLSIGDLPGSVTTTRGFRGTLCKPEGEKQILRIIRGEMDPDAVEALQARKAYEVAVTKLVARLGWKDFELLVDLILSRSGWARFAELGGTREGIDIEVENIASDEIAFVQVKSRANQSELDMI